MRVVLRTLLIASVIVATTQIAQAACEPDGSLNGTYEEILYETGFTTNCSEWIWTGGTQRVQIGSNWKAELYSDGTVTQTQLAGDYTNGMYLAYSVQVVAGTAGTERLHVQILQGATVVQTIAIYSPSDTSPSYNGSMNNYSNTAVSVRFRYVPGASPGTTKFRADAVQMWGYF